jgi:hypothetical protein
LDGSLEGPRERLLVVLQATEQRKIHAPENVDDAERKEGRVLGPCHDSEGVTSERAAGVEGHHRAVHEADNVFGLEDDAEPEDRPQDRGAAMKGGQPRAKRIGGHDPGGALNEHGDDECVRPVAQVRQHHGRAVKRHGQHQIEDCQAPEEQLSLQQDRRSDAQRREQELERQRAQHLIGPSRKVGPETDDPRSQRGNDERDEDPE